MKITVISVSRVRWYSGGVETPFGGYGKSGYGLEKGREALWNYVLTKNVAIKPG